jgi:hypothetical protein
MTFPEVKDLWDNFKPSCNANASETNRKQESNQQNKNLNLDPS